jgi:myosin heavy subunit
MAKQIKRQDISEEDLFKSVRDSAEKTLKTLSDMNNVLKSNAQILSSELKNATTASAKGINELVAATEKANKMKGEAVKIDQETIKIKQELLKVDELEEKVKQQKLKTEAQVNKEKERQAKASEKSAKAAQNEASAYKQLEKNTRELKNQSKELGAQMLKLEQSGKKNSAEYKKLAAQYKQVTTAAQQGDTQLKKLDKTVGDNFRNVGNYQNAIGGLKNVLGQLGLAFGIGTIVKSTFNVIKEFDQGVANLASVLGTTREGVVKLEEDAKRLGATTAFTASQVSQLQVEFAKLGFTETEILAATEATLNLAAATGSDLARAAEVAGATVRGMGLTAEDTMHVTDVMAKSFSTSALDMEKFAESMKVVAPIANSAGVSLEETTAMLGALANAGISGSNAGTALRRILSEVATTGKPVGEALKDLAAKGLDLAGAEDEVGKNAMSALLILSKQTEQIDTLTDKYVNADGAAKEMADTQLNTLGGAIALLQSAWEGFVLQMNDASGAGSGLTTVIKFLADNLGTIMTVLGKLIKVWIAYRTVLFSMKMADRIKEMIAYNKAVKDGSVVAGGATDGVKKFGAALKGIGLGLAITLAIELATALYDIASGAKAAREEKERMDRAMAAGTASAEKVLAKSNENLKEQLRLLDLEIRQRKANGEDEKKLTAEKLKREQDLTQDELKSIQQRIQFKEKAMAQTLKFEDIMRRIQRGELGSDKTYQFNIYRKEVEALLGVEAGTLNYATALNKLEQKSVRITQEIVELSNGKKELLALTQDLNVQLLEETAATVNDTKEKKKSTKDVKDKAKAMKDANDEVERTIRLINETQSLVDEIAAYEAEENLQAAIQAQLDSIGKSGTYSLSVINQMIEAQYELQKAILERQYLESIENAQTQQEVINARMRYEFEIDKLDKQRQEKNKEITEQLEETQENWVESNRKTNEKVVKEEEKTVDQRLELIRILADAQKAASDKRIKLIDQEIAAAEKQFDYFQDLAANGNINAKESLAEQQRLIVEANKQKEKEMRRQARIELAVSAYNAYQKNVEDKSVKNPLAKTITDITLLSQFIQNLPAFLDGTEDTGKNGQGIDGKGGFHAVLHPNERVVPKSLNEQIGSLSNSELARIASEYNTGALIRKGEGSMQIGGAWQTAAIVQKLDLLEKAIKTKPETNIELGEIVSGAMEIVKTTRKGNDVIYNRYRIK